MPSTQPIPSTPPTKPNIHTSKKPAQSHQALTPTNPQNLRNAPNYPIADLVRAKPNRRTGRSPNPQHRNTATNHQNTKIPKYQNTIRPKYHQTIRPKRLDQVRNQKNTTCAPNAQTRNTTRRKGRPERSSQTHNSKPGGGPTPSSNDNFKSRQTARKIHPPELHLNIIRVHLRISEFICGEFLSYYYPKKSL
jgi:hypothetical protein